MLKRLSYACASIFLLAPTLAPGLAVAGPGGLNLGWDDCAGLPASLNRTFACDSNSGLNTLVSSFVAPYGVIAMSGTSFVMDLQAAGATWPNWWGFRTGLCRQSSMGGSADFTSGPFTCHDSWEGGAIGSLSMDAPLGNRARIKGGFFLPAGDSRITAVPAGLEVYSHKMNINNLKTTGLSSCSGCDVGVCMVLNLMYLHQPGGSGGGVLRVTAPAMRNYATWQGGIGIDCDAATPTKNTTWGSIKAIYR